MEGLPGAPLRCSHAGERAAIFLYHGLCDMSTACSEPPWIAPPLSLPPDWARTVLPCQVQACSGRQKAPCAQGVACRNTSSCAAPCCTASERSQHALKCRVSDAHRYNSLYRAFIHSLIQATQSLDSQACSFDQKVNENNDNPWEMASERRQQTTGVHARETCK